MKLRALLIALSLGISSLSAQDVFTTFTIPGDSTNTGSFDLNSGSLYEISLLSLSGSNTFNYAWQYFTPTVTGTYAIGVQDATYDPVMILYTGVNGFPGDPSSGATSLNDDGEYGNDALGDFNGLSITNSVFSYLNPIITGQSLTAGTDYLVAITSYSPNIAIPLPTSFFVYGPSQVGVAGQAAVPEPSTYAALAGLAVFGFVAIRRRAA